MQKLVEDLCSDACAGRAPGTPGGKLARGYLVDALRAAGLDPREQGIPAHGGANVLAVIPGRIDRWVIVAAHYDHVGQTREGIFRGADDNAAACAILVEVARSLAARRPDGRGVIIAAFDAEEPPYFWSEAMGSEYFAMNPIVPLDKVDQFICMDLVGHALGDPGALPDDVHSTVFALGAERSAGTRAIVDSIAEPGVTMRRVDAETVEPLSDHYAFWKREVPFLFLTSARSRVYHTVDDVPALLAYDKMAATARWLDRFVRASCAREERTVEFRARRDDASTLRSLIAIASSLGMPHDTSTRLLAACDRDGALPAGRIEEVHRLVMMLESALA